MIGVNQRHHALIVAIEGDSSGGEQDNLRLGIQEPVLEGSHVYERYAQVLVSGVLGHVAKKLYMMT